MHRFQIINHMPIDNAIGQYSGCVTNNIDKPNLVDDEYVYNKIRYTDQ